MKKLYIIGNGFDLFHGMQTSYANFHRFVEERNHDLLIRMDTYFDFEIDQNYLWSNFEQDLCKFDHEGFMDTFDHIDVMSESFKPSEFYSLEDEIIQEADKLANEIQEEFASWVKNFVYPQQGQANFNLLNLDPNALFINFNYTDTLEELYQIPKARILYIHNNANACDGELIFGHAEPSDCADEAAFDTNGDPTRTMYSDSRNASRAPFFAFQKNTKGVLKEHSQWFRSLNEIEEVTVLGHSIGKVDWPYFQEIAKRSQKAMWKVSYYGDQEFGDLQKRIRAISDHIKLQMIRINELS